MTFVPNALPSFDYSWSRGPPPLCVTASVDSCTAAGILSRGRLSLSSSPLDGAPPRQAWTIFVQFRVQQSPELGS